MLSSLSTLEIIRSHSLNSESYIKLCRSAVLTNGLLMSGLCVRIVLMMDREERSVVCTCAVNLSGPNSVLQIATAFSKGMHFGFYIRI